ncbi:MAG: hypothetical protein IPM54_05850 [Polyangiaceae bacterium]|nr:hypothetical protein [Polyangiaceae bacterium]
MSCAIVGVVLLVGTTGCGQKKINECNQLIEVINKGVESLNKASKANANDPSGTADYKTMADTMEAVAADAAKVELSVPELKKLSQDYQAMAKEVAKAAREMVAAADSQDFGKVNTAKAAVEKAVKQEDPLVDSINKFCHAP